MAIATIITIGRDPNSRYQINSGSVSSEHAMLLVSKSNELLLIDCSSTNGTRIPHRLGPERINQAEIFPEDIIFFGDEERKTSDIISHAIAKSGDNYTRYRDPMDGSIKKRPR